MRGEEGEGKRERGNWREVNGEKEEEVGRDFVENVAGT